MKDYIIQTNSYWCSFTMDEAKGDSSVGVIAKFDNATGVMTVLTTLDEHGVGLVAELANKVEAVEKPIVVLPKFDGYVAHIARELQDAFRIACANAGIRISAGTGIGK
ncbi:TPA: hypothetical protein MYP03_004744 [Citrobacter freundii]|nr:hypothetical protein [Citrobacter freundii]